MNHRAVLLCLLVLVAPLAAVSQELFVSDGARPNGGGWKILRFSASGTDPQLFTDEQLAWPQDIVILEEEGQVLVSNLNSGRITRYDLDTGAYISDFASGLAGPTRMTFGPDGHLYVLQWNGTNPVLRFERDGTPLGAFTETGVSRAIGLDWSADGELFVSSYGGDRVVRFGSDGADLGVFVEEGLEGPTNIWFDDEGRLHVLNFDSDRVLRFDPAGSALGEFISDLPRPEGYVFLPSGDLLIGQGLTGSVRRFGPDGQPRGDFIAPGAGGLVRPNALVLREQPFTLNAGLNDAWFEPATSGQGFFIMVFPEENLVYLSWFTYETERPAPEVPADLGDAGHRWLTALGPIEGSRAVLDISNTTGGRFDQPEPMPVTTTPYGTMILTFEDCSTATLEYDIPSLSLAGAIPLQRVVDDNISLCETLASVNSASD